MTRTIRSERARPERNLANVQSYLIGFLCGLACGIPLGVFALAVLSATMLSSQISQAHPDNMPA
jgi:ABC-type nitrate/sulfonate/bicarbonate transport system permease component